MFLADMGAKKDETVQGEVFVTTTLAYANALLGTLALDVNSKPFLVKQNATTNTIWKQNGSIHKIQSRNICEKATSLSQSICVFLLGTLFLPKLMVRGVGAVYASSML